ncbi:MAG: class I SAM-dependent methyltransferase [Candidatus Eisenbacteria bacterium]
MKPVQDVALYDGLFERWMGKLEADLPMILEIARLTGGPILELGVGAGRVALRLAREGHAVTGVDNAAALLAAAAARLAGEGRAVRGRVTLVRGDLRRLRLPARPRYRLALLPFNTLMHFESLADQDKVIAGAARALGPGGHLWISLFHADPTRPAGVVRAEPSPLEGEAPGLPGSRTEAFFQQRFDRAEQVTTARYWLDTVAPDGVVRRESLELRLRWFHRFELERLLLAHGLHPVATFGDFDGSEFVDGCPQLIVLARKGRPPAGAGRNGA